MLYVRIFKLLTNNPIYYYYYCYMFNCTLHNANVFVRVLVRREYWRWRKALNYEDARQKSSQPQNYK